MATKKKMLQAAAGNAGGEALNVEDVFNTYLYTGTGAAQTITNGIDLDGEGGLVWIKERGLSRNHHLVDTERGIGDGIRALRSNLTDAEYYQAGYDAYEVTSANSNGFSLGLNLTNETNRSASDYASWTFRKAPKFFTCVQYTGTGSAQTIAHDLGSKPGAIFVKCYDNAVGWAVQHRSLTATDRLILEETYAANADSNYWNDTEPTDTTFTVGNTIRTNSNGYNYVAYLFAHNDGDGEFGADGDADIIKCGSYTGTGSAGNQVTLGWEPQWLLIKRTDNAQPWPMVDIMRGATADGTIQQLRANQTSAESTIGGKTSPNATGFALNDGDGEWNASGANYIYIAIRRGTKVPESATEVFAIDEGDGTAGYTSNFEVDMALRRGNVTSTGQNQITARLTQAKGMYTDATSSEYNAGGFTFDSNVGWGSSIGTNSNDYSWMWKRAPGFFDSVAYSGNSTAGRTVSHNLGVAPEMMWVKVRSTTEYFQVYHKDLAATEYIELRQYGKTTSNGARRWNSTRPTDSVFSLGDHGSVNASGETYIAYLFSSLAGISKVGSYTGNGTSQTIDCGFTSGARFILVKRTDSTGDWYVWDTERGIVAGNDPYLELNTTDAEVTSTDWVDPDNSGFIVNGTTINASSAEYIFYAVS